jgi:iron complex transport system permease protein
MKPYLLGILFFLVFLILSVTNGAVDIPFSEIVTIILSTLGEGDQLTQASAPSIAIINQIRLPHTILIALTGAALAGSGASFQGLFRNPLADPYLIGVASGAGLGAVSAMTLRWPEDLLGYYLIPTGAFLGALLTIWIVYRLARVGRIVPLTTLILAGVAIGSFASALTSLMMFRADNQIYRALSFLLGGSTLSGWNPVLVALSYLIPGLILLSLLGHKLNILQFGEDQAKSMGLDVERAKTTVLITATLTTAVAVAFSGVIGFIGLIVPHIIRITWGPDYRHLIPLSILYGAGALLIADLLSRVLLAPQSIPVGIITALAGTPFFLWILRRAKSEVFW